MTINGLAVSTRKNYERALAALALFHDQLPLNLTQDQVEEYLYHTKTLSNVGSDNNFKFTICALRFVYRMEGMTELAIQLPQLKQRRKLPVVLSKQEVTAMMNIPCMMKHRVIIALLYGCGLRCGELRNLKISDIDLDREVLFVRQGKGKKDRYIPMGSTLSQILKKYIQIKKPVNWLISGKQSRRDNSSVYEFGSTFGQRSIQWAVRRAAQVAGICKNVNVHSLRHTYATHLLEDGVNILSIRELLGHAHISTTMIYLHVAQINNHQKCSPLDTLQGLRVIGYIQGALNFGD